MKRIDRSEKVRVGFHQAKWDEPIIYELSTPGERGILVPKASAQVAQEVGDGFSSIPAGMARSTPVNLPEMAQNRVLRHYARLAQQTLGADVNIEIGQGTCTVKYSPKVNDQLAASLRTTIPSRTRAPSRVCCRSSMRPTAICVRSPAWTALPSSPAAAPRVSSPWPA